MDNIIEIHSRNNKTYFYNYKYNLIMAADLYDESKIEKVSKMYYRINNPINKVSFLSNKSLIKYKSFGISLTDACNFRCRYCANSSAYLYSKGYSNQTISNQTIEKALDFYMKNYNEGKLRDPNLKAAIMFYGGEPLLQFDKIKYTVNLLKQKYGTEDAILTLTTNGYLINDEIASYFRDNNFDVNLSIDGYKEIHDKNRVTADGKPTFDKVINVFYMLKEMLPKDKLGIISTFDTQVSPMKLYEYYKNHPKVDRCLRRVSGVVNVNTDYYHNIKRYDKYDKEIDDLFKLYKNGDTTKFISCFYDDQFSGIKKRLEFNDITFSLCSPLSSKLLVDTDGKFHICEKVNGNYPIGNVESGIDIDKAYSYYADLLQIRSKYCSECKIHNLCNPCFAQLHGAGDHFMLDHDRCNEIKSIIIRKLEVYCTFLDGKPWVSIE